MQTIHKPLFRYSLLAALFAYLPASQAAQELSAKQAETHQAFKEVSARGTFSSISDAAAAINRLADQNGADYYYLTGTYTIGNSDSNHIVYAKLYKANAAEIKPSENLRQYQGVYEYPKATALKLMPSDTIRFNGHYSTDFEINDAVAKKAAKKGAYAYYIDSKLQKRGGDSVEVVAFLYEKDAKLRPIQPENAIPYDSEAGRAALAQGGEAAKQVEKPGYYSASDFNEYASGAQPKAGKVMAPAASRYTVTLPDGTRVEELNDATAMKMVPFDSIKFKGYYPTSTELSYQVGKRAAKKGAKYYHITRVAQSSRGQTRTIYVDLYR